MIEQLKYPVKTFENQVALPRLPVPGLEETGSRLVEWVTPLLDEETLEATVRSAKEFFSAEGPGMVLQKALVKHAAKTTTLNWLEHFWERMYLAGRVSLPFYSNIFYMLAPRQSSGKPSQCRRAADLIISALRFKSLIDTETLPPDVERGKPICMNQYRKMFSSARIPGNPIDTLRNPCSKEDPTSVSERHVIVARKRRFFRVTVIDANGKAFPAFEIERVLERIMDEVDVPTDPVGVLTAVSRDFWAEARGRLREISRRNRSNLDEIERALFLVCLEEQQPRSMDALSEIMLIGDGRSRWFDKGMQFIVCPDGAAAINMEHTATDGSVMVRFARFVAEDCADLRKRQGAGANCPVEELRFELDDELRTAIDDAEQACDAMIADTATRVLLFKDFGREKVKGLSAPPDAFIQMAMQLAQQDVWGGPRSTYEAVMTRQFLHGRTEAVRAVSKESVCFTHAMREPVATASEKAAALRKAVERHSARMREAKDGHGVERHLLGLLNIWRESGPELGIPETPAFFSDKGFRTLTRTLLSTSTSSAAGMFLAGFGTVDDEGLGVRYLAFPDRIHFNVTSRKALKKEMNCFVEALESALSEMAEVLQTVSPV
ncbi:MAG: choline/carnitine O-acyltransferase [Thermovirgaceae bacterium]